MFKNNKDHMLPYVILALILFFLFELIFIQTSTFIWLMISTVITYIAWQHSYRSEGKVAFWIGIGMVGVTLINTSLFKFGLFVVLSIWIIRTYHQKQHVTYHQPQFPDSSHLKHETVLLVNKWFGKQTTPKTGYRFQDINIQTAIGETVIDLTATILPKGEPIVTVNQWIGKIVIIVPYDVEVNLHHSVLAGSINLLGYQDARMTNRTLHVVTQDYHTATRRIKLHTTLWFGEIEVRRG
ncbi:transporter [Halolactibacillus alkaliphilus]|uniref:Transporter n=1 Tax=Halolactibacillus alkaliphilus TaxID=442899 RepID=A0A511WWR1_9BACI|nr:cell wall-active antibiotics response protein LiaF [Halolactibacillus alkaliphilus]GEN55559.1 transporter [Halolactibacillus alkaliphilus]GGN64028.1 transporter [Halolactibacillus alkaliphilus]SFO61989.1 lia operon protein LiaF [Halolactibacillus alkaliphilus]